MPIHWPGLSRRRFLTGSAAALASLSIPRIGSAEPVSQESWALFSDTHINADPKAKRGRICMADHLRRVVEEVLALDAKPTGVFINGDLAQNKGEIGDYKTFQELIEPLSAKDLTLHLTLGNHDQRTNFWNATPYGAISARPVQDRWVSMVPTQKVNWFLLDSLRETDETPGILGTEQLAWLGETLDAHADKPAVILAHHNIGTSQRFKEAAEVVVDVAGRRLTPAGIMDSDPLLDVLAPRSQVMAYICGHTHQWNVLKWKGIHFLNLPVVAYKFLPEDPAGWVHCRANENGLTFELRSLDAKHPRHGEKVEIAWRNAS